MKKAHFELGNEMETINKSVNHGYGEGAYNNLQTKSPEVNRTFKSNFELGSNNQSIFD